MQVFFGFLSLEAELRQLHLGRSTQVIPCHGRGAAPHTAGPPLCKHQHPRFRALHHMPELGAETVLITE